MCGSLGWFWRRFRRVGGSRECGKGRICGVKSKSTRPVNFDVDVDILVKMWRQPLAHVLALSSP